MSRKTETVASKIPVNLREAMQKYINADTHLNESDFIRAAIREKILRDAPWALQPEPPEKCPHCGCDEYIYHGDRRAYQCKECGRRVTS